MKNSCMCLQCGRALEMVTGPDENLEDKNCPICGGANLVKHDPQSFFEMLFGGAGGG